MTLLAISASTRVSLAPPTHLASNPLVPLINRIDGVVGGPLGRRKILMSFRIQKLARQSQKATVVVFIFIAVALAAGSISIVRYRNTNSSAQIINYSELY